MTIKSGIIGIKTLKKKNNISDDFSQKRKINKRSNVGNKEFQKDYPL